MLFFIILINFLLARTPVFVILESLMWLSIALALWNGIREDIFCRLCGFYFSAMGIFWVIDNVKNFFN